MSLKENNSMLSSTVIGVELHRLGLKFNFGEVELQLQCKFDEMEGKYLPFLRVKFAPSR